MRTVATALIALATLIAAAPAQAQERKNLDQVFEEVQDAAGGRKILFTKEGGSFRIHPKAYTNAKRIWPFIKKGDKINIWVKGDILLKISMGWKIKKHVNAKVLRLIKKLKEGNRIRLNGDPFVFVRRRSGKLVVQQVLVDGEINPNETKIPYEKIKKLAIVKIKTSEDPGHAEADVIKIFFVMEGDTVRLQMDKSGRNSLTGVVQKLTPLTCVLVEWKNGAYGDVHTIQRRDVVKVFPTPIELQRAYTVGKDLGSLTVKVKRFRRQKEGAMTFDVWVKHDAERVLLDRFQLGFNLSEEVGSGAIDAPNPATVPMLFPGKAYSFRHTAIHARYKDAVIPAPTLKPMPYTSKEAEPHILRFLGLIKNEKQLRELYEGRAASRDADFLHLLITRALIPPTGQINSAIHAQLSLESLIDSGAAGADALISEINVTDDAYEITSLQDGHLVRSALPDKYDRYDWRRKLITQLANQKDALGDDRAKRLFEYYCLHEKYAVDLERVFIKNPDETVRALFDTAIPRTGSQGAEKAKSSLAATLLRNLKAAGLRAIDKELARRKIDATQFDAARKKYGNRKAEKSVDVALDLAAAASKEIWLKKLEKRVKKARALAKKKDYKDALKIVREVLGQNPDSKSAKKLFPKIAIPLAAKMQNGEAALLLEDALKLTPKAKKPLGVMLLRGVTEEIDAVVIRDKPTVGGTVVRTPTADERFAGTPKGDWIELHLTTKRRGYIRDSCATRQGDDYVIAPETPYTAIDKTLQRIRELNPDIHDAAWTQFGHLNAREGEKLYNAGQYELAEPYFDKAKKYAPDDPRLATASSNWLQANWQFLLLILAFLGVAAGAGYFVFKKIKEEMVAAEDLAGQDLEIILEYGIEADEWRDLEDDDDDDDEDYAAVGAAPGPGEAKA